MSKKKYIFLLLFLSIFRLSFAQQDIDIKKLEYVMYLSQCYQWPDTESKFEVKIGLYGCTPEMEDEFDFIIENGFVDGTNVTKQIIEDRKNMDDVHVLFVYNSQKNNIQNIFNQLADKPILIIGDNVTDNKSVHINIVQKGKKIAYQINKESIEKQNIAPSTRIPKFNGDEEFLNLYYSQNEINIIRQLQETLEKSALQTRQLLKYRKLANKQESRMTEQSKRVKRARNKIAFQNVELTEQEQKFNKLKNEVAQLQNTIDSKISILKKQELEIKKQEDKIKNQEKEVRERTDLLKSLADDINKQQSKISDQKKFLKEQSTVIEKQQGFLYLVMSIVIILIVGAILIYRSYKEKKAHNKSLEEKNEAIYLQKREIQEQAQTLEKTNKELEKLSIVASETDNAIRIMDKMGNYEWVNEGYTRMYGLTLDQLTIKSGNIISLSTPAKVKKAVYKCIDEKKPIIFETLFENNTDEHNIWAQTTLTPILDTSGKIKKLVAIDSDISKLKEAEAEIKQQKEEIEAQRDEIEVQRDYANSQKQKITDSIHYAQRIQAAILPPEENLKRILPEHFVLFKPRDIVSGDFYWVTQKESKIIVAAADCTGHGVPGAFMSMLGIAFLNEIVTKMVVNKHVYSLQANEILNELRKYIISSLHQTGKRGEATDGMDISLVVIDPEKKEFQFAGAHNPLFIVRDKELIQIKGDKMPIGIHRRKGTNFNNHEQKFEDGDILYMFSDGYTDQIGGANRRKFNASPFRQLLLEIKDEPMERQKTILDDTINNWMGNYGQIDDILVMGVKLCFKKEQEFKPQKYNWADKKILIAEDIELNYILLANALEKTNVKLIRAKNGQNAVNALKEDSDIDLILMDLDMPVLDGLQATEKIRAFNTDIPIIAQTAQHLSGEKEKSLEAGCNDFITKPIKLQVFLETLSGYLG